MTGMKVTVPNDVIEEAIRERVGAEFGRPAQDVTIERIIRKKGGGVEADVVIESPGKHQAVPKGSRGDA